MEALEKYEGEVVGEDLRTRSGFWDFDSEVANFSSPAVVCVCVSRVCVCVRESVCCVCVCVCV